MLILVKINSRISEKKSYIAYQEEVSSTLYRSLLGKALNLSYFILIIFTIFHKQISLTQKPVYNIISYYMYAQKGVAFKFTGGMYCLNTVCILPKSYHSFYIQVIFPYTTR